MVTRMTKGTSLGRCSRCKLMIDCIEEKDVCICNHNHKEIFYTISRSKRDWLNFQTVTKMPPHNRKRTVNFFIDYGIYDFNK